MKNLILLLIILVAITLKLHDSVMGNLNTTACIATPAGGGSARLGNPGVNRFANWPAGNYTPSGISATASSARNGISDLPSLSACTDRSQRCDYYDAKAVVRGSTDSSKWTEGAHQLAKIAAKPVFTPVPGGYVPTIALTTSQTTGLPNFPVNASPVNPVVTILDNTPYATICYTTDGYDPSATAAGTCDATDSNGGTIRTVGPGTYPTKAPYTAYRVPQSAIAAVKVTSTTTIKAIATRLGYVNSDVATGTYTIDTGCNPPTAVGNSSTQPYGPISIANIAATAVQDSNNDGYATMTVSWNTIASGTLSGLSESSTTATATVPSGSVIPKVGQLVTITAGAGFTGYSVTDATVISVSNRASPARFTYTANSSGLGNCTSSCGTFAVPVTTDGTFYYGSYYPAPVGTPITVRLGTSHTVTVTGLLPNIQYGYAMFDHVIGSQGEACGSASEAIYSAYYSGAAPRGSVKTPPRKVTSGTLTDYKILAWGGRSVTQGYSMYFDIGLYELIGATPQNGTVTIALTGEPTIGTKFNWMAAGGSPTFAKTTLGSNCNNIGIYMGHSGDVLSETSICNDTNLIAAWAGGPREVQFVTSANTPPGPYTLTITVSGSGVSQTKHLDYAFTVMPTSTPFSGVALNHVADPNNIDFSTPIPNANAYIADANHYGPNYGICAQDTNTAPGPRPNDNTSLTNVGSATTFASWFYDGVNAMFGVDYLLTNFAGNNSLQGTNWAQCREDIAEVYRDKALLSQAQQQYLVFSQGYYTDYLIGGGLHGKKTDLQSLTSVVTQPQGPGSATNGSYLGEDLRDVAYILRSYVHGVATGIGDAQPVAQIVGTGRSAPYIVTITSPIFNTLSNSGYKAQTEFCITGATGTAVVYNGCHGADKYSYNSDTGTFTYSYGASANMPSCSSSCGTAYIAATTTGYTMKDYRDYTEDHVLAQMDQMCLSRDAGTESESFFLGLSAHSLIEYYELNQRSPDLRIPAAVQSCADFIYDDAFQNSSTGMLYYSKFNKLANVNVTSGGTCEAQEDMLFTPAYAWLYNYSGDVKYEEEGDYMFGLQATQVTGNDTYPASGKAQIPGGCYQTNSSGTTLSPGSGSYGKVFSQHYYWGLENYVALRNGPTFTVFPGSVGVYYQNFGTTSDTQIITLNNPKASSVTITSVTLVNTSGTAFALATPSTGTLCGSSLAAKNTCVLGVSFSPPSGPMVQTAYTGTLTIVTNSPVGTYTVSLYGTGVIGTLAPIVLIPKAGTYTTTQYVTATSASAPDGAIVCFQQNPNAPQPAGNGNQLGVRAAACSAPTHIVSLSATSGGVVTVTSNLGPNVGDPITITNAPHGYNGNWIVSALGSYGAFKFSGAPANLSPCTNGCGTVSSVLGGQVLNGYQITVPLSKPVRAVAVAPGYADSIPMVNNLYTITTVDTPGISLSPAGNTYTSQQTVSITDSMLGAVICYTTDGSPPTEVSNLCSGGTTQTYTGPFSTSASQETITAIATHSGYAYGTTACIDSAQSSATYTMQAATITSTNTVAFTSSKAGSFSITTAGTPVSSLRESGSLPSGVTFTDNGDGTATLAGTPATGTEKSYSLTLTATSGVGQTTQLFTLIVVAPPAPIVSWTPTSYCVLPIPCTRTRRIIE